MIQTTVLAPCVEADQVSNMCFQSLTLHIAYLQITATNCGANLYHTMGFVHPDSYNMTTLTWNNKPSAWASNATIVWPTQTLSQANGYVRSVRYYGMEARAVADAAHWCTCVRCGCQLGDVLDLAYGHKLNSHPRSRGPFQRWQGPWQRSQERRRRRRRCSRHCRVLEPLWSLPA